MSAHALPQHLASGINVTKVIHNLGQEVDDGEGLGLEGLVGPQTGTHSSTLELGEEVDVTGVGQQVPVQAQGGMRTGHGTATPPKDCER